MIAARMVVCPLIALGALKLFALIGFADAKNILLITFLAAITPAASTVMQLAKINERDAEYATAINILTTIVCIVTMPLFVMLYDLI